MRSPLETGRLSGYIRKVKRRDQLIGADVPDLLEEVEDFAEGSHDLATDDFTVPADIVVSPADL
jgi:hypothetical protein